MIYQAITARNGAYEKPDAAEIIRLTWAERQRRVLRTETSAGRSIGIELETPGSLRHGDLLGSPEQNPVVVEAASEPVLILSPRTIREAALAAHIIGNRHLQAWIGVDEIVVERNGVLQSSLEQAGIPHSHGERVLDEAHYVVSGGGHSTHGHSHTHR